MQPRLCECPVSRHRPHRGIQGLSCFDRSHAGEVSHLDHLRFARVDRSQVSQRRVHSQDFFVFLFGDDERSFDYDPFAVAAALLRSSLPSMIDQDMPHEFGSYREEMRPIFPALAASVHHLQIALMD